MIHRSLFSFTLILSLLAACDDHKGDEGSTLHDSPRHPQRR
jgi:hypothetical protein